MPGRVPGGPACPGQWPRDAAPARKVRLRRTRRLFRRRPVRAVSVVVAAFLAWAMISLG